MNNKMYKKGESDKRSTIYFKPYFNYEFRRARTQESFEFMIAPCITKPDGSTVYDMNRAIIG